MMEGGYGIAPRARQLLINQLVMLQDAEISMPLHAATNLPNLALNKQTTTTTKMTSISI